MLYTGGRRYEKKSEAALPQPPPPTVADLNPNDTLEDLYYLGQPPPPPVTTSQGHDWPQGYQPHSQSSGLGYQPPPQDPAHLYAKPTRRPRPPKNQQAASTSVPILSPMPASPSAYAAPIYSMEDVHGSMGRISLQGARVSESEL